MISVFHTKENIMGKGENAGNQHFLLFPQCFQKVFFLRVVETRDCVVTGNEFSPLIYPDDANSTSSTSSHSSVGRVLVLKTRCCGFNYRAGQKLLILFSDETLNRGPV